MSEVVSLRGTEICQPGKPQQDVVELAEKVLNLAQSGEIKGFVAFVVHHDEAVSIMQRATVTFRLMGAMFTAASDAASIINQE